MSYSSGRSGGSNTAAMLIGVPTAVWVAAVMLTKNPYPYIVPEELTGVADWLRGFSKKRTKEEIEAEAEAAKEAAQQDACQCPSLEELLAAAAAENNDDSAAAADDAPAESFYSGAVPRVINSRKRRNMFLPSQVEKRRRRR